MTKTLTECASMIAYITLTTPTPVSALKIARRTLWRRLRHCQHPGWWKRS